MTSYRLNTGTDKVSLEVSLVDLATGKRTDRLDIGPSDQPVEIVAVLGTTLATVGGDHMLRIATATKLP